MALAGQRVNVGRGAAQRRTRTPSVVGRSPAALISTPSGVISSISFPMSCMGCSSGTWPHCSFMWIIDSSCPLSHVVANDITVTRRSVALIIERGAAGSTWAVTALVSFNPSEVLALRLPSW